MIQYITENDTICAISTPPGVGGIAVARISGPKAIEIADKCWQGHKLADTKANIARYGTITDSEGKPLDDGMATVFRAPKSFTGEDTVEVSVHGSRWIQRELINTLISKGCRLAEPGEFTRRAFTSGKLDLAQAEAVADMIASSSRAAHRIAINQMRGKFSGRLAELRDKLLELASLLELELDFSEEQVEFASRQKLYGIAVEISKEVNRLHDSFNAGSAIRDGIPVAIVGATNAGKSSLLNALVGDDRAIVSDIHGTTRDIVEDTIEIGDYLFRFMDTAGLRHTDDQIEAIGIDRSIKAARRARVVILVIDASNATIENVKQMIPWQELDNGTSIIIALNKSDLEQSFTESNLNELTQLINAENSGVAIKTIRLSAMTGDGIDNLRSALTECIDKDGSSESDILVTNARHAQALGLAAESIQRVISGIESNISGDFIAQDIRETTEHLAEILGQISNNEVLGYVFSRFCIGK
jgi:tRNA modification GTPase